MFLYFTFSLMSCCYSLASHQTLDIKQQSSFNRVFHDSGKKILVQITWLTFYRLKTLILIDCWIWFHCYENTCQCYLKEVWVCDKLTDTIEINIRKIEPFLMLISSKFSHLEISLVLSMSLMQHLPNFA